MIGPKSHIGDLFARRRQQLNLTQSELARRMGKTQTYVARVEGEKRTPRWDTVLEFARALEMEPSFVPRESIPAVQAALRLTASDEVPPLAGETW